MPKLNKHLSQNFLRNPDVVDAIVAGAGVSAQDTVLEIGPGDGVLTLKLLEVAKQVVAVEFDERWAEVLKSKTLGFFHFDLQVGNFLDMADAVFEKLPAKVKVVANLPYHITTPILERLITHADKIESMTLMVQKEVAERIASQRGSDHGLLSLYIQLYNHVEILFIVKRENFKPVPGVDSAVMHLVPRFDLLAQIKDLKVFRKLLRQAFWAKRKTLKNNFSKAPYWRLSSEQIQEIFLRFEISEKARAEELSLEQWIGIMAYLAESPASASPPIQFS
jgi:16S rRNA (adenine1518-N6/adenine1519-N6)-dimethyltransferase